ncbi:hypothetical protein QQF64_031468 [Cirrhinus molitorella]|uniref:Uncharacterized protein n=1 Tax=Cirrhinus molitorella TaxID=172907 RepID=A0ABR3MX10_9TELE
MLLTKSGLRKDSILDEKHHKPSLLGHILYDEKKLLQSGGPLNCQSCGRVFTITTSDTLPNCIHTPVEERMWLKPDYVDTLLRLLLEKSFINPGLFQEHLNLNISLTNCVIIIKDLA